MSKTNKSDDKRKAAKGHSLCAWVSLGIGSLPILTGCNNIAQNHTGDPLYGEYYPKGPNGQPMPPPSAPARTSSLGGVPPYPASNTATSTAALAGNVGLPGAKALAINDTSSTPGTLTNTTTPYVPAGNRAPIVQPIPRETTPSGPVASAGTNGFSVPPIAPPVNAVPTANTSQPIITAGSWSAGTQASTGPVAPLGVVTPEILQSTLAGKGAKNLKQENVPEGVRVSCYAPDRANPTNYRYLETVARDNTTALQALLAQIEP
jgi:hypothetical protein